MTYQILQGDCIETMRTLPDACVQTCVTSPPYFGLRDYQTATWEGGSDECDHKVNSDNAKSAASSTLGGSKRNVGNALAGYGDTCGKCGAKRIDNQIGLEDTPEAYVAKLVDVFREVRRLLKDDGTLWVNLGDSFSNGVGSNLADCFERIIKGGALFLGGTCTLTVAAKSDNILTLNGSAPNGKLTTLFGVQRVFIKQRDNNLLQVLNLLNSESCIRISPAVPFVVVNDADLEIVLDEVNDISVVVTNDDLDTKATLGVPVCPDATVNADMPFSVKESAEPIAKRIGHVETVRAAMQFDAVSKSIFQVNPVHDLIAGRQSLMANTEGFGDFSVTKASPEHLNLSLSDGRINIACGGVAHVYFSNAFGSLVRYSELYDKAQRKASAQQAKQELGIPEMVKRALMEDGWICRSTIIWHKPNPMPESVTDRPTKAHEYIFLLSKSARYYYDADAIREEQKVSSLERLKRGWNGNGERGYPNGPQNHLKNYMGKTDEEIADLKGRNKRSVWSVTTQSYDGAHFATYPVKLIEPCILAGSAIGDTVLDPFNGSGTTGAVALKHGRQYIGCELNPDYIDLAHERIGRTQPQLLGVTA